MVGNAQIVIQQVKNHHKCKQVMNQLQSSARLYRSLLSDHFKWARVLKVVTVIENYYNYNVAYGNTLSTLGMFRFRLAGYPAIFSNPVPAKTVPGTGYLSRIVLGPFWQLVELSSHPAPYCKHVGCKQRHCCMVACCGFKVENVRFAKVQCNMGVF